MHDALDLRDLVSHELDQRRESGYEVRHLQPAVEAAVAAGDPGALERLLEELEGAPRASGWAYEEPSEADAIAPLRPGWAAVSPNLDDAELRAHIYAAWLGRCAGCNLGKPFEGMDRASIRDYLDLAGAHPLSDWVPLLDPLPERFASVRGRAPDSVRGNVRAMARDDDIDFTILGLILLERHGFEYTSDNVARAWLERLPFLQIFTAERVAYRNLLHGIAPPATARFRNPYREWIGAQIRADAFGYVCPGDPVAAADLAYNDAALSHIANGIYGEQWAAALVAASFTAASMREALTAAWSVVPSRSRLAEALELVADHHAEGLSWDAMRDLLEARYGQLDFVHTIQNAAVVAAALLWGEGDFTRTIGLAVEAGWDTDCNAATAGSAFGAMHGLESIPERWTAPLNDTIRSALFGCDGSLISDLAGRTASLAIARSEAYT